LRNKPIKTHSKYKISTIVKSRKVFDESKLSLISTQACRQPREVIESGWPVEELIWNYWLKVHIS